MAAPEFNVWTGPVASQSDDEWVHRLETSDIDEAILHAEQLADEHVGSIVYELGRYRLHGLQAEGHVAFWWSSNLHASEGIPRGRGHGWSDDHQMYVTYSHPGHVPTLRTALAVPVTPIPPARVYAQVTCDSCGLFVPQNETRNYSHWLAVGRSSGSSRSSSSQSTRVGSRSSSTTYRHGSSSSSGRTYYKRETMRLCSTCYAAQKRSDFNNLLLKTFIYGGGAILFIAILLSHHRS